MAQLAPALNFVLDDEDRSRSYEPAMDNNRAPVIAGINRASWPAQYDAIARLPVAQRPAAVAGFYSTEFWTPMKLAGLDSQDVANRVLDMGVNAGSGTAIKLLQRVVGANPDGIMGTATLGEANILPPEVLLSHYRQARVEYYKGCKASTQLHAAWEARAKK